MTLIVYSFVSGSSAEAELSRVQNSEVKSQEIGSVEVQEIEDNNKRQTTTLQQGQEILLNGRRLPVAWTQWQKGESVRTGMSDTGAMQTLGIELLNTKQTNIQPVLWFPANPVRPISLEARLLGSYRYIDITDLMTQADAKMQVVGNTLNIELPQPRILDVRQGNQTWGKRLVIDLDRPVFWQTSQAPNQGAVIIEGIATPQLLAQFKPVSGATNVRQNRDEDDLGSGAATSKKSDRLFRSKMMAKSLNCLSISRLLTGYKFLAYLIPIV